MDFLIFIKIPLILLITYINILPHCNFMKNKIIAIDGPTASGKGTLAKKLAKHFSIPHLNTGGLYRLVAFYLMRNNDFKINLESGIDRELVISQLNNTMDFSNLDDPELYTEDVGAVASKIAVIPEVRKFLLDFQINFSKQPGGAVLDGRDIGSVICPHASYKFFLTASAEQRAKRRYEELLSKGKNVSYEDILNKIKARDRSDLERTNSPLIRVDDAVEIDSTSRDADEVFEYVLGIIGEEFGR